MRLISQDGLLRLDQVHSTQQLINHIRILRHHSNNTYLLKVQFMRQAHHHNHRQRLIHPINRYLRTHKKKSKQNK